MNLQAYAKHRKARGLRGTSHVAVLKAIESGRLTEPAVRKIDGKWLIDAPLADAQWAGNTDPSRSSVQPPLPPELPGPINTRQPHPAGGGPSLAEAKRARAVYQAERERVELMQMKGELIPAAEVKSEAFAMARVLRDRLMSIPDRIAPMVSGMTPRDAHQLISEEIRNTLRMLADGE
jgi:hypothetical protein